MSTFVRSVIAALLLAVPVAAEAVSIIEDEATGMFALFGLTQVAGWLLAGTVVRDLSAGGGAASQWGSRLVMLGVAFQLLFALATFLSWAFTGEPAEASFIAFGLGFICLTVGGLMWAVRLRRTGSLAATFGLAGVAVLGFVAIAAGDNIVHEIALQGSYLAWVLVGVGAATGPLAVRGRATQPQELRH